MNVVAVAGHLSSEPSLRELPSGSVIANLELTTRIDGTAVSVPLAWVDPPHDFALHAGDEISVVGTVRRRFFRAGGSTQSRTEVVIAHLASAGDKRGLSAQRKWLAAAMGPELVDGLRSVKRRQLVA